MTIHEKLAAIYADMTRVGKDGTNDFHRYAFTNESDLKDHIRPHLSKHGLYLTSTVEAGSEFLEWTQTKKGERAAVARLAVLVSIVDGESGVTVTARGIGFAIDTDDKAFSKAQQSGIKYATIAALSIATGEPEADHASPMSHDSDDDLPEYTPPATVRPASAPAQKPSGANPPAPAPAVRQAADGSGTRSTQTNGSGVKATQPQLNLIEKEGARVCADFADISKLCVEHSNGVAQEPSQLLKFPSASNVINALKALPDGYFRKDEEVPF